MLLKQYIINLMYPQAPIIEQLRYYKQFSFLSFSIKWYQDKCRFYADEYNQQPKEK